MLQLLPPGSVGSEPQQQDSWRSVFDAALVKAQQAVQLDELGETTLAANLYAQAANDLGRVIPMCGSEKKKQSMLAIQAIYLDRVLQLKAIVSSSSRSTRSASPASIAPRTTAAAATSAPSLQRQVQQHASATTRNPLSHARGSVYGQESQFLSQAPYQPPPPPPPQHSQQSIQYAKKRSKSQQITASQSRECISPTQDGYNNIGGGDRGYSSYGEYSNNSMNTGSLNGSTGCISPPSSTAARSPTPPIVVSPIFMAKSPSAIPASTEQQEDNSAVGKPSRWRPFGKKKSKSFSTGESSSVSSHIPNDYEIVPRPQRAPIHPANVVDPADHADAYSQQQQADWMVGHGLDSRRSMILEDYEQHTQYFDDDDGDAEVYYFADSKGRARTSEGKESGKKSPKDKVKKKSRNKAGLSDGADARSSEHISQGRSTPVSEEQIYMSNNLEAYGDLHPNGAQQQYQCQDSFDPSLQFQHSAYSQDPSLMPQSAEQDAHEADTNKSKGKWFGKKKKSKEGYGQQKETYDDVAKIMDEALFGGEFTSRKKTKDKLKDKRQELSQPTTAHVIARRKDSLTEYSEPIEYLQVGQSPKAHAGHLENQDHCFSEDVQYQRPKQLETSTSSFEAGPFVITSGEFFATCSIPPPAPHTPKALTPIAYAPRTTYTPSPKKHLQHEGSLSSMTTPNETPEAHPLSSQFEPNRTDISQETKSPEITEDALTKKSKAGPFNLFKGKKSNSKVSMKQENDDPRRFEAERSRKGSIQNGDSKATDTALATGVAKKKRDSDEYVPYEYQEDVEGPLMERVEVSENREVLGFVMPIEENIDYTFVNDEEPALDNWDSWVSQLESFEKVISDKGMEKDKTKKSNKGGKETPKDEVVPKFSPSSSPSSSVMGNRSSMFSTSTSLGRHSISNSYDMGENRPLSVNDESVGFAHRHSFQSSQSSAVIGHDTTVHHLSFQQGRKRWWNPARKEATSLYSTTESLSVSEHDQERYLSTLLQNQQNQNSGDKEQINADPVQIQEDDSKTKDSVVDLEREDALNALLENSMTIMSLPPRQASPVTNTTVSTQEIPRVIDHAEESNVQGQGPAYEEEPIIAPMPKVKTKSSKPKLLPISTPLAQLLKLTNPEELWQYVQQAKTYATTKMNKGDKRSAAIALKRAQALEARWQEVLLEMASSDEDEDGLLDDDEDEDESGDEEENQKNLQGQRSDDTSIATFDRMSKEASLTAINIEKDDDRQHQHQHQYQHQHPPTTPIPASIQGTEDGEEDEGDEEDERRRMVQVRKVASRSDNAPDMYSKYKNKIQKADGNKETESNNAALSGNQHGCRLGPDATLEQLLETSKADDLKFYIQRLKTDTVAKARSGSKFAALEGMKNVKVLQQRLEELEDVERKDKGAMEECGDETEKTTEVDNSLQSED
ncbi:hypothetical protein BGX28_009869 [Mortierella sp. GBA30]|nr:hypothetical protein BGX28_009869 [Mortierella sp. GBA30]